MEIEWRTIQLFIDSEGMIDELSVDSANTDKMRCTCVPFKRSARCKHTKFMREKFQKNEGVISLVVPPSVSNEDASAALEDMDAFREMIIKYGKVEYLK